MKNNFALVGLNKPWKVRGFTTMYATVDLPNEDWFHAIIDMPEDRTKELWNWLTGDNESFKGKMCVVEYDYLYADGIPKNPKVVEIYEVPLKEYHRYFDYSKMKTWREKHPDLC